MFALNTLAKISYVDVDPSFEVLRQPGVEYYIIRRQLFHALVCSTNTHTHRIYPKALISKASQVSYRRSPRHIFHDARG